MSEACNPVQQLQQVARCTWHSAVHLLLTKPDAHRTLIHLRLILAGARSSTHLCGSIGLVCLTRHYNHRTAASGLRLQGQGSQTPTS